MRGKKALRVIRQELAESNEPDVFESLFFSEASSKKPHSSEALESCDKRQRVKRMAMRNIRIEKGTNGQILSIWIRKRRKSRSRQTLFYEWREVWHRDTTELYIFVASHERPQFAIPEEVWEVLNNRNHFKTCHCCGYLEQVDDLIDQVCLECRDTNNDQSDPATWAISYLKSFIEPAIRSGSDIHRTSSEFQNLDPNLDYLAHLSFTEIDWASPWEPFSRQDFAFIPDEPIPMNNQKAIDSAFLKVINNRKHFDICCTCGELNHLGHMDGGVCHSCMEEDGVCF